MAKEVNKEVKKKLQHQCPIIKYYENTKYALNRKVTKKIRFYGIYFNKFHIHILHRYSVCDAFQLRGKKILHLREELQHMIIERIFF
jgi:hypothetical protein